MSVLSGFFIITMVIFIVYMVYRFVKSKNFIVLVPISLQVFSLSISIISFINNIEMNQKLQVFLLLAGIVLPAIILVLDYLKMIQNLKEYINKNVSISNRKFKVLELVPVKRRNKKIVELSYKYINPSVSNRKTVDVMSNLKIDEEEIRKNFKRLFTKAQFYINENDFDKAYEIYRTAIKLVKSSPDIYFNYADICYEIANYDEASSSYLKAIELHKKIKKENERIHWLESIAKSKKDTSPELKKMLDKENDTDYFEAAVYYNLGNTEFKKGRFEQAIEYYEKAVQVNPEMDEADENLAASLIASGKINKAIEHYEVITERKSEKLRTNFVLGRLYGDIKEYDKAVKQYFKCTDIDKKNINVYSELGNVLLKSGMNEKAVEVYNKLTKMKRNSYASYYNQGMAYFKIKQMKEAIDCFNKAIKLRPDSYRSYYNMALALDETGKYNEAVQAFKKTIEYNDNFLDAYNNLGILFSTMGNYSEAVNVFRAGTEKNPEEFSLFYNLGVTLSEIGRNSEAVKAFRKALSIKPDEYEIYYHLGNTLTVMRKYTEAIKAYKSVLTVKTKDSDILYNLAIVYSLANNQDIAVESLKRAIELDDNLKNDARYNSSFDNLKTREDFRALIDS